MEWHTPRLAGVGLEQAATFISAMELALANGDKAFLEKTEPLLQDLIDRIQREVYALSELQLRGCIVREACAHLAAGRQPPVVATDR